MDMTKIDLKLAGGKKVEKKRKKLHKITVNAHIKCQLSHVSVGFVQSNLSHLCHLIYDGVVEHQTRHFNH